MGDQHLVALFLLLCANSVPNFSGASARQSKYRFLKYSTCSRLRAGNEPSLANTSWSEIIFFLKNRGPDRWRDKVQQEVTGDRRISLEVLRSFLDFRSFLD